MKNYFSKELYNYDVEHNYCKSYLTNEEVNNLHDKVVTPLKNSRYGRITLDHKVYTICLGHCVID